MKAFKNKPKAEQAKGSKRRRFGVLDDKKKKFNDDWSHGFDPDPVKLKRKLKRTLTPCDNYRIFCHGPKVVTISVYTVLASTVPHFIYFLHN